MPVSFPGPLAIGDRRVYRVRAYDKLDDGSARPHAFAGTEPLAARLWRPADGATLARPPATFADPDGIVATDYAGGYLFVEVRAADSAAAGVPGTYGLEVKAAGSDVVDGRLSLTAAPGAVVVQPARLPATAVYCTEEDVALEAPGDFARIVPADQVLASGNDGALAAGSWDLTSAGVADWLARGLTPGMAVVLRKTTGLAPPEQVLIADLVGTDALTLRRKAQGSGVGQPPGGAAAVAGITFAAVTLFPQIERASYDLNREFGIDELIVNRRYADLYDPREVRQACVWGVLARLYEYQNRQGGPGDEWAAKAARAREIYRQYEARTLVHFRDALAGQDQSSRQMRITR